MTERPKPYIGVSGVASPDQQRHIIDLFYENNFDRDVALGVKAVHKTQYLDIENKYGTEWYPVGEDAFANAMIHTGTHAVGVAQVCFDSVSVHDVEYRNAFVKRIQERGKAWLELIQFDMLPLHNDKSILPWLEDIKNETGLGIILQVHGEAMSELGPKNVARELSKAAQALDYILFDASHGKGMRMNAEALLPFLGHAYFSGQLEEVGMGVAGGLHAEVVREDIPTLLKHYPDISWDAEGQLHPEQADGTRPLDMQRIKEYFEASHEVLEKVQ